jgi:hypothetical protein
MSLRQKQVKNLTFPTLAALTASTLDSPEFCFVTDQNKFYTKIAGVNTIIDPSSGGGGTVTSTSVISTNGFSGSVATATTTPAITIGTTVTGLLKGNGTAILAAVSGTDYLIPNTAITAGTGTKITYDAKGLVTSSTSATATDIVNTPTGNISSTNVQAAIAELDLEKQAKIQIQTAGSSINVPGFFETYNFTEFVGTSVGNVITFGLGNNVVTNDVLAQVPTNTIKGRVITGTGNATDLTGTQVTTILDTFIGSNGVTAGLKGLVPTPAIADNTKYLRGDGTWQTITTGGSSKYSIPVTGSAGITCRVYGDAGITVAKSNASTLTFVIPSGKYMQNFEVFYPTTENPGSNYTHIFDYTGNTITNQGNSTADVPDYKSWFASGLPTDIYHARAGGSVFDFVTGLTAVGSGNITMLGTFGSTGLSSGDIIVKGSF